MTPEEIQKELNEKALKFLEDLMSEIESGEISVIDAITIYPRVICKFDGGALLDSKHNETIIRWRIQNVPSCQHKKEIE